MSGGIVGGGIVENPEGGGSPTLTDGELVTEAGARETATPESIGPLMVAAGAGVVSSVALVDEVAARSIEPDVLAEPTTLLADIVTELGDRETATPESVGPTVVADGAGVVSSTALAAEAASRGTPLSVSVATYLGIDPSAYPTGTVVTAGDIGVAFVVEDDAVSGPVLTPKRFRDREGATTEVARLTGAVEEDAEARPWAVGGTGGTVASDGTKVTFTSTFATSTSLYREFAGSGPFFFHGMVAWTSLASMSFLGDACLALEYGSGNNRWYAGVKPGNYEIGDSAGDTVADADTYSGGTYTTLSTEHHLMALHLADCVEIYVNGQLQAVAPSGGGAASSGHFVSFADYGTGSGAVTLTLRECYAGAT